jgi:hypothetical protein
MILSQTVVLPEAVPPAMPTMKGCRIVLARGLLPWAAASLDVPARLSARSLMVREPLKVGDSGCICLGWR